MQDVKPVVWYSVIAIAVVCWALNRIQFPREMSVSTQADEVGCRVSLVDVTGCLGEVDGLSSREQFWGPRGEPVPEDLRFPQWDEMKFIEPEFVDGD